MLSLAATGNSYKSHKACKVGHKPTPTQGCTYFKPLYLHYFLINLQKNLYQEKALGELYPMVITFLMDGQVIGGPWMGQIA